MKFKYLGGPYIEFRGVPFVNGQPSNVEDQATIDILSVRIDFKRIDDEKRQETSSSEVLKRDTLKVPKRSILRATLDAARSK